ncbi:HIRA-interacting protein 3 [Fundulus heteroclitus]|uniref:HIRA-interacting protein 3 n=1 Tax=Fundulus heteroclitus TaxID=8078 RepID=UPI00165BB50B|nr:HIRA-interacting protein 3 [Fundulus heteroclitus]
MMASEKEKGSIRRFVKGQLRDGPDLSTLTLGILKKRYLAQEGCESLTSEAKQFMKQVVGEELAKMQESNGGESEPEINKPKRKREREKEELESDAETKSAAKKSRSGHKDSPSDSEDEQNSETGSQNKEQISSRSASEEEEEESEHEKSKKTGQRVTSDESSDEEVESENGRNENLTPKEKVKKKAKKREIRSVDSGGRNTTTKSDKESGSDAERSSEKIDSSADDKENGKKGNDSDSDSSSSLPSVDDEKKRSPAEAKDKKQKKTKTGGSKDEEKSVVRLKRYIALCGVWKNYKKLLDGCRSTRSKVAVLKQELKNLGVNGHPSIEKCKKIRLKREEAQELAELDVNNIITTEGRPKRRGTSANQIRKDPPSSYQRTLNSDSDSHQESDPHKGRKKMSEWANLHGIISDDADTN